MKFDFSIGGFFSDNFSLKLKNGKLEYKASMYPIINGVKPQIFVPKKEQWKEFIIALTKYQAWKKEYRENNVYDGTQWELKLQYGKIKIKSFGSNSYPENFKDFIKDIQKLTGNKNCFKKVD